MKDHLVAYTVFNTTSGNSAHTFTKYHCSWWESSPELHGLVNVTHHKILWKPLFVLPVSNTHHRIFSPLRCEKNQWTRSLEGMAQVKLKIRETVRNNPTYTVCNLKKWYWKDNLRTLLQLVNAFYTKQAAKTKYNAEHNQAFFSSFLKRIGIEDAFSVTDWATTSDPTDLPKLTEHCIYFQNVCAKRFFKSLLNMVKILY